VANTQAYLLDAQLQPVPLGVAAELCFSGEQVARGYYGNEGLTNEKFVPHPIRKEADARIYRTGDLCKFLPDGNLVYIGKLDRQSLVKGTRFHPEFVETALTEHPGVLRSSVLTGAIDGEAGLGITAFVVPQPNSNLSEAELRQFLKPRLQERWIPTSFVITSELPMRPSGKPD
jgi:acyl-CoA synthetase (AMP-forming)/AMP-acid ligase II